MSRPPRDAEKDHLASHRSVRAAVLMPVSCALQVTINLVIYSYPLAGVWQTLTCFLAAFLVFNYHGIPPSAIPFSAGTYWQTGAPDYYGWNDQVSSQALGASSVF